MVLEIKKAVDMTSENRSEDRIVGVEKLAIVVRSTPESIIIKKIVAGDEWIWMSVWRHFLMVRIIKIGRMSTSDIFIFKTVASA